MKTSSFCTPVRMAPVSPICRLEITQTLSAKPDLAIYNAMQEYQQGRQPTWDNPDISTYRGSDDKQIRLIDKVHARIKNLSNIVPATNALVHCYTGAFGIGTALTRLSTQMISVEPQQQCEVEFPVMLQLPNGEQRIAVRVVIELPGDVDPSNNTGSQIAFGGYASVLGRNPEFEFPVVNTTGQTFRASLSALENQLSAVVQPQSIVLNPMEEIHAKVSCQVPDSVHGQLYSPQRMNVTVACIMEGGELYGGLTHFIFVDD
jgi:hypothetical protein